SQLGLASLAGAVWLRHSARMQFASYFGFANVNVSSFPYGAIDGPKIARVTASNTKTRPTNPNLLANETGNGFSRAPTSAVRHGSTSGRLGLDLSQGSSRLADLDSRV